MQAQAPRSFFPTAALAALVPCWHRSALTHSIQNLLLLQFLAARAQGVSNNYVVHETKTPPSRRLRRARSFGLGRKLYRIFPARASRHTHDLADIAHRAARRHDAAQRFWNEHGWQLRGQRYRQGHLVE